MPDERTFELYNLRVEISDRSGPIIGRHKVGDYFEVIGEDIFLPPGQGFSIYSLAALLPLLPAKQRPTDPNDWMSTDAEVACPSRFFVTPRCSSTTKRRPSRCCSRSQER